MLCFTMTGLPLPLSQQKIVQICLHKKGMLYMDMKIINKHSIPIVYKTMCKLSGKTKTYIDSTYIIPK